MAVLAATAIGLAAAGAAAAQDAPAPPSWTTLTRCAEMADEDARLACYDAAMRSAGFTPKPEAVAAEKRKRFGLSIPQVSILKHKGKEEGTEAAGGKPSEIPKQDENEVTVELSQVATLQPDNRLMMFTADGAIWEQVGDDPVQPFPKAGDSITIHKGKVGGYLCDVNKYKAVRCKRDR